VSQYSIRARYVCRWASVGHLARPTFIYWSRMYRCVAEPNESERHGGDCYEPPELWMRADLARPRADAKRLMFRCRPVQVCARSLLWWARIIMSSWTATGMWLLRARRAGLHAALRGPTAAAEAFGPLAVLLETMPPIGFPSIRTSLADTVSDRLVDAPRLVAEHAPREIEKLLRRTALSGPKFQDRSSGFPGVRSLARCRGSDRDFFPPHDRLDRF